MRERDDSSQSLAGVPVTRSCMSGVAVPQAGSRRDQTRTFVDELKTELPWERLTSDTEGYLRGMLNANEKVLASLDARQRHKEQMKKRSLKE